MSEYDFYADFIETVAKLNYSNLGELKKFESLSHVSGLKLLEIAREMHIDYPLVGSNFERVITEVNYV